MCGVKMFCFSRANHTSTNFKMFLSWKLDKFNSSTDSLVGWNLENLYKHAVPIFFRLSWHFKREKPFYGKHLYCKTRTDYSYSRLVRISLLISNLSKEFFFFLEKVIYKSNRKLFFCVCIAWYKHSILTVMQNRENVEGLHNDQAIQIQEKSFLLLKYCYFWKKKWYFAVYKQ